MKQRNVGCGGEGRVWNDGKQRCVSVCVVEACRSEGYEEEEEKKP